MARYKLQLRVASYQLHGTSYKLQVTSYKLRVAQVCWELSLHNGQWLIDSLNIIS